MAENKKTNMLGLARTSLGKSVCYRGSSFMKWAAVVGMGI